MEKFFNAKGLKHLIPKEKFGRKEQEMCINDRWRLVRASVEFMMVKFGSHPKLDNYEVCASALVYFYSKWNKVSQYSLLRNAHSVHAF